MNVETIYDWSAVCLLRRSNLSPQLGRFFCLIRVEGEMSTPQSPRFPSYTRQAVYGLTGAIAGSCTVPIEAFWQRYLASQQLSIRIFLQRSAGPTIYRAAVRFWVFDITKQQIQSQSIPTWVQGGLSGAAGGFAELSTHSLIRRSFPSVASLTNHSNKLFICFGVYTYLSTTLSPDRLPPRPFWYCWLMGAAAGGLGSGLIAATADGIRGKLLWKRVIPKGALTIGTVIAVQVTSCSSMLQAFEG